VADPGVARHRRSRKPVSRPLSANSNGGSADCVSVLGAPGVSYLLSRAAALIGSLGQAFAPMHLPASDVARRTAFALLVITPYVVLAWRGPSKAVARPYIVASALYLLILFILLPTRHLRYFLPFALIVGWSVSGYLELFRRPMVRAAALVALLAVTVLPSFFLVGGLYKVPPPVAALDWVKANHAAAILYSHSLRRHANFYWSRNPRPSAIASAKASSRGALYWPAIPNFAA
jgi:hypothetical protein